MASAAQQSLEAIWRIEGASIIAVVARMVRDIGLAEELAQDALVAALEHWPSDGVPHNPVVDGDRQEPCAGLFATRQDAA